MAERATPISVPNAHAGPISDSALEELALLGADLQAGRTIDTAGAHLLTLTFPQIAKELIQRRKVMALICDVTSPDNVIEFPEAGRTK